MSETKEPALEPAFPVSLEALTEVDPEQNLQDFDGIAQRNHVALLETGIAAKAVKKSWYDDPEELLDTEVLFCVHRRCSPYMTRLFICAAPKVFEQNDRWLNAHVGDIVRTSSGATIKHPEGPYTEEELDIMLGIAEETEDTMKAKEIPENYPYLDI